MLEYVKRSAQMIEPNSDLSGTPAFGADLRHEVARFEYTKWASGLTEEQLLTVLWAVGEYGRRWEAVLACLDQHEAEFLPGHGFPRARLGLELLGAMANNVTFTVDEVTERVRAVLWKWRADPGLQQKYWDIEVMDRFARVVLGYHGCDPQFADALIRGEVAIDAWMPSTNPYDWLGHGIYFWEHGPERARVWGSEGGVVGAVIQLGRCLDLTDVGYTRLLAIEYENVRATHEREA